MGNQNAAGPHDKDGRIGPGSEFRSVEHAQEMHELLSDFQKNGVARPAHLEKLGRVKSALGIGVAPVESDEDRAHIRNTQGAIEAFHRTMIAPHLLKKPSGKIETAKHRTRLQELQTYHETAKDISQDKSLSLKEREERVKGLLWHGRDALGR